jgi:hypothetical protein
MACAGAFLVSWIVGYALCRALMGGRWPRAPVLLRLGLSWPAGSALSGMVTFWAIALAPFHRGAAVAAATTVALAVCVAASIRQRPDDPPAPAEPRPRRQRVAWWIGAVAFVVVLALWLAHGLDLGVQAPAGDWDGVAIWNQRARFFYQGSDEWTRAYDPALALLHPEYPNLLPSLVVYGWLAEGRSIVLSAVAVAIMAHVCTLLLIVGLTQAAYPRSAWPWFLGIFYALIPQEWSHETAWEYADRPLAAYLLAALGCWALAVRERRQRWLVLAGLFTGAAAFCKDEGKAALVLIAIGVLLMTIGRLCRGGGPRAISAAVLLAVGLVPGLASLGLQRMYCPAATNLIAKMTIAPLTDTGRTAVIAQFLENRLVHASWGGMWLWCALALATLWPWLRRAELWLLWLFPSVQLLVYVLIFQLTPEPLEWHLETALPRLLFHIGPTAFLAASWLILEAVSATEGSAS